jgi:formiminoglutamase
LNRFTWHDSNRNIQRELKNINTDYQSAQRVCWTGRKSNPDIGNQYWYQEIELYDISDLKKKES